MTSNWLMQSQSLAGASAWPRPNRTASRRVSARRSRPITRWPCSMPRSGSACPICWRRGRSRPSNWRRRLDCRRRMSTASCAGCAPSAFARSSLKAHSPWPPEANAFSPARRPASPTKSRSWLGNIGARGPSWCPPCKPGRPPSTRCSARALRNGAATTPRKARCSNHISPRRPKPTPKRSSRRWAFRRPTGWSNSMAPMLECSPISRRAAISIC